MWAGFECAQTLRHFMAHYVVGLCPLLLILRALVREGCATSVTLEVRLYSNESDGSFSVLEEFSYDWPFTKTSSNFPSGGVEGYVFNLDDASDPKEPPFSPNSTWMALVRGSSDTLGELIDVARTFGYSAILAYAINGSSLAIDDRVSGTQFPVVLVNSDAADYIISLTSSPFLTVYAEVSIASDLAIVLGLVSLSLTICILACTYCFCRWQCVSYYEAQMQGDMEFYQGLIWEMEAREQAAQAESAEVIAARLKEEAKTEFSRLPEVAYDLATLGNEPNCPVCYADFEGGTLVKILPCGHFFHSDCIGAWLVEKHLNCPVCRQDIVKQETTCL